MTPIRAITILTATLGILAPLGAVHGDLIPLSATHDPLGPNFFTLDFHDGSPRAANITSTNFGLEVDDLAGTAMFTGYLQNVEPLELFPGVSTGPMVVTIIGSEIGTYDRVTGIFTTNDIYQITFDDSQLAAFGITAPQILPSTSTGVITFGEGRTANTIAMDWVGNGVIAEMPFDYTCRVSTNFEVVPEPATIALLGLAGIGLLRRRR